MAQVMTPEARRAFLTSGTRTAILATTRPDGRPHAVPVCFALEDDDVLIVTNEASAKGRDLQADPRVTLVVDEFVVFARKALGLLVRVKPTKIVALDRVSEH